MTRFLIVLAGIVIGQSLIYGPCLLGERILLPLDLLSGTYMPRTPEMTQRPWDESLEDRIIVFEPARRFAVRELHAGRFPMWTPDYFAGAPFGWPLFSPFVLLTCLTESPVILAWAGLAIALVAGFGMYQFCRRVLGVGFWPACICGWCYPLTGFFIMWQGFLPVQTTSFLPWLLLAVDRTARCKSRLGTISLALMTALTLVAGQLDIAGQSLLVSGLYAVWCLWDEHGWKWLSLPVRRAALGLAFGWFLGFMLAAPQVLPTVEYAKTGSRIASRVAGTEERPPGSLAALPLLVVPDYYGRSTSNTVLIEQNNLQESAVGAYAGSLLMLFAAPLAFWSRRHRSLNLFLVALAVFGVGWALGTPGLVQVLRLPGLNMMSHNRLVFATSFALVALAGVGLEVLSKGTFRWRPWHWLLAVPVTLFAVLCIHRAIVLPEPVATQIAGTISRGESVRWIQNLDQVHQVQAWYRQHLLVAGVICAAGTMLWFALAYRERLLPGLLFTLAGTGVLAELVWFTQARQPQSDPAWYYPPVPALEQTARAAPGRVIGYRSLPANLASMAGLRDVRGYDAVDPAALVELLATTGESGIGSAKYARTLALSPQMTFLANGDVRLPGILDMLGVRYVIGRGEPHTNARPLFSSLDYYVLENTNALPRAFIPRRVECIPDHDERLRRIASSNFNPRELAFVETPIELPQDSRGQVEIRDEIPTRVTIEARMETAGLVVLSDQWYQGWRAHLDGQIVPILRANHAVRGVIVPPGTHRLEFRYLPASFTWGLRAAGVAALLLLAWAAAIGARRVLLPRMTGQIPTPKETSGSSA